MFALTFVYAEFVTTTVMSWMIDLDLVQKQGIKEVREEWLLTPLHRALSKPDLEQWATWWPASRQYHDESEPPAWWPLRRGSVKSVV